jgi:hypothetical protein
MSTAAILALLTEIIAAAPAAFKTGKQIVDLVNSGYKTIRTSLSESSTPEEINELVKKIVANHIRIQSID